MARRGFDGIPHPCRNSGARGRRRDTSRRRHDHLREPKNRTVSRRNAGTHCRSPRPRYLPSQCKSDNDGRHGIHWAQGRPCCTGCSYDQTLMRIRLLSAGDEPDLIAAAREFNDLELSAARAVELLSDPTFVMVIAETDDGELMARIYGHELRRLEQTDLFLYEVDTAERHRRKGAGRAMLDFISTLCRSRGYGEWFVPTECDNLAGNALYRSVGAIAE